MAALTRPAQLDLSGSDPREARAAIRTLLAAEPKATRKVYAALAHKTWTLLIERRFDAELRDWHGLLQRVRSNVAGRDAAFTERVTALSDLLRESISFAETSPARQVARRPHAKAILHALRAVDGHVSRQTLMAKLKLNSSYLSNILTMLVAHSLIERRGNGKEAEFVLTALGREILDGKGADPRDEIILQYKDKFDDFVSAIDDRTVEMGSFLARFPSPSSSGALSKLWDDFDANWHIIALPRVLEQDIVPVVAWSSLSHLSAR